MSAAEILVVDDDRDIRDSLCLLLRREGYTVRTAANGAEAMVELNRRRPDLVILDVMMSTDTEGFDLALELRDQKRFGGIPIVLLTSFLDKVRQEGPDAYQYILGEPWPARWLFEKPIEPSRLLAKVEALLAGG
jgi:DNA-binding response OmpR family regulator